MHPVKILLIDDDEDDYILTKDLFDSSLNSSKYELYWSNNYSEGINAMLKGLHDVYLVDYRLGKHSGIDLLNEAVKSNCTKPIIILTGMGDPKIDEEALQLGAADYLVKDEINSLILERSIRYAVEHYKTLQKLKDSENKFRIIFERSKDPMLITDFHGNIYEANSAAITFFETSKEYFLTQNCESIYKNPELRKVFVNEMGEKGSVTDLGFELITSSGQVKYCSISSFIQISQHGNRELYYSTIHDLTHRKLQEQQVVLEEKLGAIERIAKNLAVEINNPLSNVNLAIDELKTDNHQQEELILLDIIKRNCDRINELTAELISSTQLSSLKMKKIDFSKLLNASVREAESLYNLNIVYNLDETAIWLNADEISLSTVFLNVFQNAADAIDLDKGQVIVEVKQKHEAVAVEIIDNGYGISEENLNKIFEPFFTTKAKAPGLGLTHSQRIIQAHNGKLEVNSGVNGTSVSIILPS